MADEPKTGGSKMTDVINNPTLESGVQDNPIVNEPINNPADNPPADAGQGTGNMFSQEDVNRIVGERLSRERSKYEGYDSFKQLAEYVSQQSGMSTEDILKEFERRSLEVEASQNNVPVEIYQEYAQLKANEEMRVQQERKQTQEKQVNEILKASENIKKFDEEFDLNRALDDPQYLRLLQAGVDLEAAYKLVNPQKHEERIRTQLEDEIRGNIQKRNSLPFEAKKAHGSGKIDISQMSSEQLAEIGKRARRGEKIVL